MFSQSGKNPSHASHKVFVFAIYKGLAAQLTKRQIIQ
jgi:hypothetical protein